MELLVSTLTGEVLEQDSIESFQVIEQPSVHFGWWVFWLIMFWPALVLVYLVDKDKRTQKVVAVVVDGEVKEYTVDDINYGKLKRIIKNREEGKV